MSRFVMKQRWFSFGDSYAVRDAANEEVLRIKGKVFSIGNQLSVQDMEGDELAFIDQKLLHWGPTYEIWRRGRLAAVVKKAVFTMVHCKFTVDVPGPDDLIAEGNFWDNEYTFRRHGQRVASVSREFFSWADTYGIDVPHGEDPILIIASAVVIDLCCHGDNR
jgi:uncharacterized protein YxjI